ncbi:MAG: CPCC family cysteine-rich protein [Pseudomonadota bacterium]|nr:CPCC family cysteine-rich protein [Pseudomonadota bacterium]
MSDQYYCPCCGYKGLDEEPPGSFDICDICGWEDDYVQFNDHDYEGGANGLSLRQWQHDFIKDLIESGEVPEEERNPDWVQLSPPKYSPKKVKTNYIVGSDGVAKKNT